MHEIDIHIEPNEKFREVIRGERATDDVPESEEEFKEQADHHEVTDAHLEIVHNTPEPEDHGADYEQEPLSWSDFSVSSDPDPVAKMATYFDGMDAAETTGRLRAKLRLLDPEVYADVQIAATAELQEAA